MGKLSWAIACLVGLALCVAVSSQCAGRPDGTVLEIIGCWQAKICRRGNVTFFRCKNNTVLERDTMTCNPVGVGNTACGTIGDCYGRTDGMYADANCQTFYWCISGAYRNYSRNYCAAPLLFYGHGCDHPRNIPPPCGTGTRDKPTSAPAQNPATKPPTASQTTFSTIESTPSRPAAVASLP